LRLGQAARQDVAEFVVLVVREQGERIDCRSRLPQHRGRIPFPAYAERLRQIVEAKAPAIDAAAVTSPKGRQPAAIRDLLPGVYHRPDQLMGLRAAAPGEIR